MTLSALTGNFEDSSTGLDGPLHRQPQLDSTSPVSDGVVVDLKVANGLDRTSPELTARSGSAQAAQAARGVFPVRAWMITVPLDLLALSAPALWAPSHLRAMLCLAGLTMVMLYSSERHRARLSISTLDDLPGLIARGFVAAAVVAVATALRHPSSAVAEFMQLALVSVLLLAIERASVNSVILFARRRRLVQHPAAIIGSGALATELDELIARSPQYGLTVVALFDDSAVFRTQHPSARGLKVRDVDELESSIATEYIDTVIVAEPMLADTVVADFLRKPEASRCDLLVAPRMREFHPATGPVDHIGAIPIMRIRKPNLRGPAYAVKRGFDLVVSIGALVVLAPLLIGVAVAVWLEGSRPVLFRQPRMTRDGRIFDVIKFRSMTPATATESAQQWNVAGDMRIGPVGRFIRRTSLDELPQLWNIVRGEMTLVGPRPERPFFVEKFSEEHPRYGQRHRVTCGLTGLAQVSGLRGDTPIEDRARFDNFYIENWSLWLDVKVLARTVAEVLGARGR